VTTSSQKTAIVAASVLSVLAFFQLVVVFIVLFRQPKTDTGATHTTAPVYQVPAAPTPTVAPGQPPPATRMDEPTPLASAPVEEAKMAPSEVDILVKRATAIRDQGDMSGTLASLRDAQKLFPDEPRIVAEFAATYEQMGLVDKALAQWKRVAAAGEKAGDLYGVAAEKVRAGVAPQEPPSGRDEQGLQPGSTLGLVDVTKNYDAARSDTEKVSLRMGIKARQNAAIIPSQVNIQAMFYDLIDNQEVEPTDPQATAVTSDWLTAPADWKEDGLEVLKVRYEQKNPGRGEKLAKERKYLGYIIRVYYQNELQDVIAEPIKLLQNFPPPVSLQREIPL
jgi:hypothetical protein